MRARPTTMFVMQVPTALVGREWLLTLIALFLLGLVPAAAWAADARYRADIVGVKDSSLLGTLTAISQLIADADRPPPTVAAIRRRADADMPRLQEALASLGY